MIGRGIRAELLWVALGQALTLLLSISALKLLTSLLGPEDYGRFALGLTLAGTLNLFVYGPLGHALTRYFHICSGRGTLGEMNRLLAYLLRWSAFIILFVGIAATVLTAMGAGIAWGALVAAALAYGVTSGVLSVYLAEMNTRRERRGYALLQTADALLRLAAAAALTLSAGATGAAAMAGFLVGSLASLLIARFALKKTSDSRDVRGLFGVGALGREFGGYAFSITLFAIPGILSSFGDRWIILQTLSAAHVGIYVALSQIANAPANLLLAVFSQTMNPVIFQRAGDASSADAMRASRRLLYRALLLLVALLILAIGVSFVFGEIIVRIVTSPDFAPYARLLWVLVLSSAIFQIAQALASEAFLLNKPFLLFLPKLLHAAIFLGLSLWLVQDWKLDGVAIAGVAAATVYLLLILATNRYAARACGLTASLPSGRGL